MDDDTYDRVVTGHGLNPISLETSSTKEISIAVRRGWERQAQTLAATRKGIRHEPINFRAIKQVFAKLTLREQRTVALNIIGGFQTQAAKAIWQRDDDVTCTLFQT